MTGFSLKDQLFNRDKVEYLAKLFAKQNAGFAQRKFVNSVMKQLQDLELKQRITWIAENLEAHLPGPFPEAVTQILNALPEPLDENKTDDDFGDFIIAPLGEFVVRQGMEQCHFELALHTLKEITKRFSMEDAMRAFIRKYPRETMAKLMEWTQDSNYHVRRLVSESTRPSLPWSGRIPLAIDATLPLLDALHADQTRYVTRSIANHLNDIAKKNAELVVKTLKRWQEEARQDQEELMWMTRHALRTLIKQGHAPSLNLLGYHHRPKISTSEVRIAKRQLSPGETLEFTLDITALRQESLVIDYVIDFPKAGGKRTKKVFKAAKLRLAKGETRTVRKKHKLLAQATTFRLYAGEHGLTVQINGMPVCSATFFVSI